MPGLDGAVGTTENVGHWFLHIEAGCHLFG